MPTTSDYLAGIKAGYLKQLADEAAYCAENGITRPTYNLDGERYEYTDWRDRMLAKIRELNYLIQTEKPFMKVSRGRT